MSRAKSKHTSMGAAIVVTIRNVAMPLPVVNDTTHLPARYRNQSIETTGAARKPDPPADSGAVCHSG